MGRVVEVCLLWFCFVLSCCFFFVDLGIVDLVVNMDVPKTLEEYLRRKVMGLRMCTLFSHDHDKQVVDLRNSRYVSVLFPEGDVEELLALKRGC